MNDSRAGAAGCPWSLRLLIGAHALLALGLLSDPTGLLARLGETPSEANVQRLARILGARHLLEGVVLARRYDDADSIFAAAGVDATHAVTMLVLARVSPEHRRLALINALLASTLCGCCVGCWASLARRAPRPRTVRRRRA